MYRLLLIFFFFLFSCGPNTVLKEAKLISSYPSASGIEFVNDNLYVIGDDANSLLILDKDLIPIDSVRLYSFTEKRIPKSVKPDLESIAITKDKKLMLFGSGSLVPYRNIAWLMDPVSKQKDSIRLDTFYARLAANGIKEVNIEGAAIIPGLVILSNRGNKNYPHNYLVITRNNFWEDQTNTSINLIKVGTTADTTVFNGVSGITYSSRTDRLILSISTEDTRNAMDDGAIGKSYLWIIKNFSSKRNWKAINPDQVIDLDALDQKFQGQKIESVCITKETKNFLHLVLAADNDNGSSTLFKLIAEKN